MFREYVHVCVCVCVCVCVYECVCVCVCVDWIEMLQGWVKWQIFVNTVINLRVTNNRGNLHSKSQSPKNLISVHDRQCTARSSQSCSHKIKFDYSNYHIHSQIQDEFLLQQTAVQTSMDRLRSEVLMAFPSHMAGTSIYCSPLTHRACLWRCTNGAHGHLYVLFLVLHLLSNISFLFNYIFFFFSFLSFFKNTPTGRSCIIFVAPIHSGL